MEPVEQYSQNCPLCASKSIKIIHGGLPMRLCSDEECSCLYGFWSWWTCVIPFTGYLMVYEGGYFKALWHWLTSEEVE